MKPHKVSWTLLNRKYWWGMAVPKGYKLMGASNKSQQGCIASLKKFNIVHEVSAPYHPEKWMAERRIYVYERQVSSYQQKSGFQFATEFEHGG